MKSYVVHIENKILFFYCQIMEEVQVYLIQAHGNKPYTIEETEFRNFYGHFSGFGAPGNRYIILNGEIWRMGKYTPERCIIRHGNKTRYLMKDGQIHLGCPPEFAGSTLHPLLQEWQRKEFN